MEAQEILERNLRAAANDLEEFSKREDVTALLDYPLEVNQKKEGTGVEAIITSGGPTIWADTEDGKIYASWNGFEANHTMSSKTVNFLEEIFK